MKFAALVCFVAFFAADGGSKPVEQQSQREDLLTQCLVHILSKALYKSDDTPLDPECKNILTSVVKKEEDTLKPAQEELKKLRGESTVKEEKLIEDLLKADKREELDDERSQEEFPSFVKRRIKNSREEMENERSQKEIPSFVKRRIKDSREEMENERSQEEFPSFMKRRMEEKRDELDDERSQEEFPSFMKRRIKEKRDELDDERSQEEFPSFYKRGNKHKREDPDDERSQEEFPQKRYFSVLYKRDNPDEERSQEEFPVYEYKRSHLLTSREKREEPDYDRSQEDFPIYTHKRNHGDGEEEDEESEEREKRTWKPSHRYHHKKKHHKRNENEDFEEPDYDRSQEDFPSYSQKRSQWDEGHIKPNKHLQNEQLNEDLNSQEKRSEESEEVDEDIAKRYWKPTHRYHHKKHHKRDSSEEDYEERPLEKRNEDSEESEEMDKRIWKPTHRYHHKKLHHKRGDSIESEDENEPISEKTQSLHDSTDAAFKHHSPKEEKQEIAHELNEKRHPLTTQEEEDELKKGHQSSAEEKQDRDAALRYLTKKKNELQERLLNKGDVYEKRSPWINREYYHPAWYKRGHNVGESTDQHPYHKLEDLAETLRYKRGILTQEEEGVPQQKLITPDELKELEKLASVDQQKEAT
ncbi:trichohyalin-like isoform X2 [Carassius auratus]|uniref:Trichohyalin-like isoform X2 n=1 Tax=Carassius auratus TaxID=7957 RepID=A0A6P6MZZ4_CARAU|nr:trichohyalin-like isoform X2 [Carassius auratus]XP_052391126.1 trichohyalin-like isoform X2 [Carassius gibelio]